MSVTVLGTEGDMNHSGENIAHIPQITSKSLRLSTVPGNAQFSVSVYE